MKKLLLLLVLFCGVARAQTISGSGLGGSISGNTFKLSGGQTITSGGAIVIGFGSTNSGVNTGITDDDSNSYTTQSLGCLPNFPSWCFTTAWACNLSTAGSGGNNPTFTTTWSSGGLSNSAANIQFVLFTGTAVACGDTHCASSVSDTGVAGTVNNGCSITTTQANEMLITLMVCDHTLSPVQQSPWSLTVSQSLRHTDNLQVTATGTYHDAWTYNTNHDDMINSQIGIISSSQPGTGVRVKVTQSSLWFWPYGFSPAILKRRKLLA